MLCALTHLIQIVWKKATHCTTAKHDTIICNTYTLPSECYCCDKNEGQRGEMYCMKYTFISQLMKQLSVARRNLMNWYLMNTLMSEFPGLLEHAEPCCCLIPGKNYFPHTIFLNNLVTCQFLPTSLLQQLPKSERMLPPRHMKPANCNLFNCFSCCAAGQRNSDESPTCPLAHT